MKEFWKKIPNIDGYEASNIGRIKSINRVIPIINGRIKSKTIPECILKPILLEGYPSVSIRVNGVVKLKKIHRLVAETFIENPDNLPQINHKDGNKLNNSIVNLEWCTPKHNIKHAIENNLITRKKGEEHYFSRLTKEDIINIRELRKTRKLNEIANIYGISFQHVSDIANIKTWKHL